MKPIVPWICLMELRSVCCEFTPFLCRFTPAVQGAFCERLVAVGLGTRGDISPKNSSGHEWEPLTCPAP